MKFNFERRQIASEQLILLLVDFISITLSTALTWWLRFRSGLFTEAEPFRQHILLYVVLSLFWILVFALRGQYRKLYRISRYRSFLEVVNSVSIGLLFIFIITFERSSPIGIGRLMLLFYGMILISGAGLGRVLFSTIQKRLLEHGHGLRSTIVIGSGERALSLVTQFARHPGMGYRVVARLAGGEARAAGLAPADGTLDDLERLLHEHQVVEVVVTDPERELLFEVIQRASRQGVDVLIVPDLYDLVLGNVKAFDIWGMPVIQVFPHLMAPWQFLLKRLFDLLSGVILFVLGIPLLLLLPPLIRMQSPGAPALFRQRRVGKGGREFTLFKFRTLHPEDHARQESLEETLPVLGGAGAAAPLSAASHDSRLIPVGRFLRRFRIDEWPQVWNVLVGQMSLVGPRPEQYALVEEYIRRWPLYARRHNVRPGLTGWAQVRQHYDQSLTRLEDKLSLDLFYLENMSLGLDLKILLFTIRTILMGQGR